jgi:hypothetical protein
MTVNRGKKHQFLGMDMVYSTPGVLGVLMTKHIDKAIDESRRPLPRPLAPLRLSICLRSGTQTRPST